MKVIDVLNTITENPDYVINSLYLKSLNDSGCVYKYLIRGEMVSTRKEIFIATNIEEVGLELIDKNVLEYTEVFPAD